MNISIHICMKFLYTSGLKARAFILFPGTLCTYVHMSIASTVFVYKFCVVKTCAVFLFAGNTLRAFRFIVALSFLSPLCKSIYNVVLENVGNFVGPSDSCVLPFSRTGEGKVFPRNFNYIFFKPKLLPM